MFNDTYPVADATARMAEREDRERHGHASRLEHEVIDLLRDDTANACRLAHRFAALIRLQPNARRGENVADILLTLNCGSCRGVYWWARGDGTQHHAWLDAPPHIVGERAAA